MTNRILERTLSRTDRQKLSAVGLVTTTVLLLVMAGVAAGNARSNRAQVAADSVDVAQVKAEMLERTLADGRDGGGGRRHL